VNGNPLGAKLFAIPRDVQNIRKITAAGISNQRDLIDINAQSSHNVFLPLGNNIKDNIMRGLQPGFRLLSLLLALFAGQVLVLIASMVVFSALGNAEESWSSLSANAMRGVIFMSQLFGFLVPGLFLSRLWGVKWGQLFGRSDRSWVPSAVLLSYFVSLPVFSWAYMYNMSLAVPEWWPFAVEAVPEEFMELLSQEGIWALLANLITIGLLPAVAEELVFRGLLQPSIQDGMRHKIGGIVVTALIFSFIHLDFQGLLPRSILGLVLGFSYYYSRSLIWPILIHFIHNGGQVLLSYLYTDFIEVDSEGVDVSWGIWPILSGLTVVTIFVYLNTKTKR